MRPGIRVMATLAACILAGGAWGAPVIAQTPAAGWTLIVRIVPNPLPIGRCAGISEEVQDDEGYRRTELSNGGVIDFHAFRYDVDTTNFQWRNGNPIDGVLCTRAGAPPSSVTVTVTLPDGLVGSAQLTSIAAGQIAASVQYAPQAPLRRPGVPPPHVSTRISAVTAPSGGTPTMSSTPRVAPMVVTTSALMMTGSSIATPPQLVTTAALTMTGNAIPASVQVVTTAALSMTGSAPASAP